MLAILDVTFSILGDSFCIISIGNVLLGKDLNECESD